jgi:ubiquitin-like 1-activating enzyme E1 B
MASATITQRSSVSIPMTGARQSLGTALTLEVKRSRVLLVGAGGIGCELLKNLVCCGFGTGLEGITDGAGHPLPQSINGRATSRKSEIVVIDLDTIDLSNLNRQFLFRKQHIKKPKALVAKETASQFNPAVHIDAHHASIFDNRYDIEFFEGFDIVFNALDNITARRHVNKMCLAADIPLIESGTTGFSGQVQAIRKGVTECYDCLEKPVQKSFPICTIRSTPSQPIHCIVWAKSYLLPELFGASEEEEENGSEMTTTEGDNAEEIAKLKEEAQALKKIRGLIGQSEFAVKVFNKVFHEDIERLRSMSEMWKTRKQPESLRFEAICIDKNPQIHGERLAKQDQLVWGLLDNLKVFCYSLEALGKRVQAGEKVIEFDKDDKDTLDLVASAANLRSLIFSIPTSSEWDIKQMAGNIIPAIATSNAITASLCVLQGFKVLRYQLNKLSAASRPDATDSIAARKADSTLGGCKKVYLESKSTERLINSESLAPPRPDCPVCSPVYAKLVISDKAKPLRLQSLVDLLQSRFSYDEFSLTLGSRIIYDPDLEDNLDKLLANLDITSSTPNPAGPQFLTVTDGADEPRVDLVLSVVQKRLPEGSPDMLLLPEIIHLPPKPKPAPTVADAEPSHETASVAGDKRKRDDQDVGRQPTDGSPRKTTKRSKTSKEEAVVIEEDGPINLD